MAGKPQKPSKTDIRLGKTLQILRTKRGLTLKDMANMAGVTLQQMQKYETADNRIAASRLYDIAQALKIPVGTLYSEPNDKYNCEPMHDTQMMDLIYKMYKLSDADRILLSQIADRLAK